MQKLLSLATVATLTLLIGCQEQATEQAESTEPAVDVAAEEAALNALADQYETDFAAKNLEGIVGSFTPDAVWVAHDGTRTEGAEAMRAQYTEMFASPGEATIDIQPETIVVAASGDVAYTIGTATVTATGPDGQAMSQTTAHLVTFAKGDDGTWKVSGGMDTAPLAPAAEGETEAP
jgi:uncharacterized protein (TIGR02246 family)